SSSRTATRGWPSAARPTRTWWPATSSTRSNTRRGLGAPPRGDPVGPSERFGVGLLGHGTVGSAFAELLEARAGQVQAITGLRPELRGVLTRSRGDFDEILAGSQLVVELMGGLDPARDYVL